jgi:hypothetical protein
MYGHRFRVLLNHDAVFLAELISLLSGEREALRAWNGALQSYNCLRLPPNIGDVPFCLEYAATATLILANFKLLDQCADSRNRFWRWIYWFVSPEFRSAFARLSAWGFPTEELRSVMAIQDTRERRCWQVDESPCDRMTYLAEPTATATALFLRYGAQLTGKCDTGEDLAALGQLFGRLVYVLDALADYGADSKNKTFNAIRASLELSSRCLEPHAREWAIRYAKDIETQLEARLVNLPFTTELCSDFLNRLRFTFQQQTGVCLPIIQSHGTSKESSVLRRYLIAVMFPWRAKARQSFLERHPPNVSPPVQ